MTKTTRHGRRFVRVRFLLPSLATLPALADLAVAATSGFASTDATDPYLWLEEIDGGHGASVTHEQLAHRLALSYTHLWTRLGAP